MWFDSEMPGGKYKLNLEDPYERAVLVDILYATAHQEGVGIRSLEVSSSEIGAGRQVGIPCEELLNESYIWMTCCVVVL